MHNLINVPVSVQVYLDVNEEELADKLLRPLRGPVFRRSVCHRSDTIHPPCLYRPIWIRIPTLQTFSVTDTVQNLQHIEISVCGDRLSGIYDLSCQAERHKLPVETTDEGVPPFFLFSVPEPDPFSNLGNDAAVQIEVPDNIMLFGRQYQHIATTFFQSANSSKCSGHYTCVLWNNDQHIVYDGLKSKWKPPFFHVIDSFASYQRRHPFLRPSLIIYAAT
jgi:hypothetical protein